MTDYTELAETIERMAAPGKGILAADESFGTIAKRFKAIDVESTEENRRTYRSLLVSTPGVEDYIGGVIFFEETLGQRADDGRTLPEVCEASGIVPGIKVDKGTIDLVNAPGDKITQGLDGLPERLAGFREQGARFTKWRNTYTIGGHNPTPLAVSANAEVMARYAALVQAAGMVPIVEPEVLMDGDHGVERCAAITEWVHRSVFDALYRYGVSLEHMVLKPNMILPGKERERLAPEAVAEHTLQVLKRTVPAAVPAIAFLSGGQTPAEATANLNAINAAGGASPWSLTFSYGRALQEPAQQAWRGHSDRIEAAQQAFYQRARLNGEARRGSYSADMEAA
ncbi:class I fructose-bisphosphate aldolase [Arhodomonas aquaeolei]|uniref:class I fructose-bisphosphate aldolase n=1 Tax=Arhodomonas aquaeolei TaxID=2369 RepID=UPI000368762A|nr:class I fructose-bisphosphate aldolase [Arhodomonas aquaeolei]